MILFLIKKTFFDFWDNLITIILLNVGFLVIGLGEIYLLWLFFKLGVTYFINAPILLLLFLYYLFFVIVSIVFFIYVGAVAKILKKIADFKRPDFQDFYTYLKETYKASSIFAVIASTYFFVYFIAGRFYLGLNLTIGGLNIGGIVYIILFFITFFVLLASQYFFPLQSTFDLKVKKNIKKMFLILFDNTGFSIFLFILNIIIIALSFLTFFVFFGISVNLLLCTVAFKLRLYKYDYLEEHPDYNKRSVPWDELLSDDRDMVGKRTLRGMIFPWKE
jgi:uncharacterized membrane protein YesL